MNMKETPTNPRTHRTPGIPLAGALDFSQRLTTILAAVTAFIFARNHLLAALSAPLHNRIVRASRRIAALLARLAEGTFRPRPHTPRPPTSSMGHKGGPPPFPLPGRRAWLVIKFGYHAAAYASHLEHLLRDPATLATIAAAPPEALKSLGRTLRPIAHLLGVTLPPTLLPSPRLRGEPEGGPCPIKPANPPNSQSGRPKLPPLLPLYPQARPRDLPFMRFGPKIKPV